MHENTRSKHIIVAGIFGNALEWYDFSVYAFFVPVLAKLFFPSHNTFISLLQTFGVFALGFLIRPLGAILFGYIGDLIGRKTALIISILLMSIPTFCVGLLPTYQVIGLMAPILLTLLRLLQGLAVSGELTTATSFLVEHAYPNRRGFAGSLAMCSAFLGIALSSLVTTLTTEIFNEEILFNWGWRLPFLLGGVFGLIGLLVRLKTVDPSIYQEHQKDKKTNLLHLLMSLNYTIVACAVLLTAIMAVGNYLLIGYFNTFLVEQLGLPIRHTALINFISLTVMTSLMPFMGLLSDRYGRKPILTFGTLGMLLVSFPVFWLFLKTHAGYALCGQILFVIPLAAVAGVIPTTLAECFATYHRNTGLAVSYNLSLALFGGTAPLIAVGLTAYFDNSYAPAGYLLMAALVSYIILKIIPETRFNALR